MVSVPNTLSFSSRGSEIEAWDHYGERIYQGQEAGPCPYSQRLKQGLAHLGLIGPLEGVLDDLEAALQGHRHLADLGLALHWEVSTAGLMESPRRFLELDQEPATPRLDPRLGVSTARRPPIKENWEQLPCLPYSLQLRVEKLSQLSIPEGPILLLGDDDFMSVGLRWGRFRQPLMVLDIDEQVLQALESFGVGLDLRHLDLRNGLPDELRGRFACVITDPPYALDGMQIFLEAARAALVPGGLLLLSTQPLLLSQAEQFPALLEGLELEESWLGLNRYPFPPLFATEIGERLSIYGFPPSLARDIFCPPFMYANLYAYRTAGS